jgi:hypothetical protein
VLLAERRVPTPVRRMSVRWAQGGALAEVTLHHDDGMLVTLDGPALVHALTVAGTDAAATVPRILSTTWDLGSLHGTLHDAASLGGARTHRLLYSFLR